MEVMEKRSEGNNKGRKEKEKKNKERENESNLTRHENDGLKSLKKRVEDGKIFMIETDKSKRIQRVPESLSKLLRRVN